MAARNVKSIAGFEAPDKMQSSTLKVIVGIFDKSCVCVIVYGMSVIVLLGYRKYC